MKKAFKLNSILAAVFTLGAYSVANATTYDIANDVYGYTIYANSDGTNNSENLNLFAGNGATGAGVSSSSIILGSDGVISIGAATTNISSATNITGATSITGNSSITGTLGVSSNATVGGTLGVTGATTLSSTLNVVGQSTTAGINNTGTLNNNGAFNQTGTTSVTGTTTINTAGNANTTIGNSSGTGIATIQSGTSSVVVNNTGVAVSGTTNSITGTTNSIIGLTNINVNTNNATNINSGTSTGAVTIGNSANVTNINSGTNNMGVGYSSTNNIGTGGVATTTNIGNTQAATLVTANAGNASMALANNSASLTVPSGATGVSNGFATTTTQSAMTGGSADPTRMTLSDTAATFSRVSNGAPITVTGVADGRQDFDAVNVRQFATAVAAVSAQANIPSLAAGQDRTFGLGVGSFMGKSGLAMGMNIRGENNAVYKLSVSSGMNNGSKTVVGAGAAWGF